MRAALRAIVVLIIVAAIAVLVYFFRAPEASTPAAESAESGVAAASLTLARFGMVLQQVSLLAPSASSTIAAQYAPYVAPALLLEWESDPSVAPGREVSSPWPDHVEITSAAAQGNAVNLAGNIVLMTSNEVEHGGNAGLIPFTATISNVGGSWLITNFSESSPQQ
ncbi:MAG: hypothetical protein ACREGH_00210 [Minisyncoccia bacterium]